MDKEGRKGVNNAAEMLIDQVSVVRLSYLLAGVS